MVFTTAISIRNSRALMVIASFARKLAVCFIITMVFVMSLQIISKTSLESMSGVGIGIPYLDAVLTLKVKMAKQLKSVATEEKRNGQEGVGLIGQIMWLVVKKKRHAGHLRTFFTHDYKHYSQITC